MKYIHLTAFWKHLIGACPNHLAPAYTLVIREESERNEVIAKVVEKLRLEKGQCVLKHFEASSCQELIQELDTISFLTGHRLLVVENCEKLPKFACEQLASFLDRCKPDMTFIFSTGAFSTSHQFYQVLEKVGVILDMTQVKPWERERTIAEWLQLQCATYQKNITSQACQRLLRDVGPHYASLDRELEKLISYLGTESTIDERAVEAVVVLQQHPTGWEWPEAILQRDGGRAVFLLRTLLEKGESLFALLRLLRSQLEMGLQVCALLEKEGGDALIQERFPFLKGELLRKKVALSRQHDKQFWKQALLAVDETELSAKNCSLGTFIKADQLGEQLIWRLLIPKKP